MQEKTARRESLALLSGRTPRAPTPNSEADLTLCVLGGHPAQTGLTEGQKPEGETAASPQPNCLLCRKHREGGYEAQLPHNPLRSGLGLFISPIHLASLQHPQEQREVFRLSDKGRKAAASRGTHEKLGLWGSAESLEFWMH